MPQAIHCSKCPPLRRRLTADLAAPPLVDSHPTHAYHAGDGNGYCGETSIQSAGLFYGNWISSERVRYAGGNAEILVGSDSSEQNAQRAATSLRFTINHWNSDAASPQYTAFVAWVKGHIDAGHPVVGTVMALHGDPDSGAWHLPVAKRNTSSPKTPLTPLPGGPRCCVRVCAHVHPLPVGGLVVLSVGWVEC
jgi:hypothetical protein